MAELTTEQQQFAEQNKMSPEFVKWFFEEKKDNCGNAWFLMAAAMWEGWKGLDSREVQPVICVDMDSDFIKHIQKCSEEVEKWPEWKRQGADVTQFTTPPSPAVPDEIPEIDRGEGGSDIDYMAPQEIYDMGKTDGWNACRAAMLAAAPQASVNERIAPHIFSKMVNKLTDISREFSGTQQLRARIIRGLEEYLVPDHPHTRGEVVVTKDEQGDIVSVTRQDSEGRVLEIIAERGNA